MSSESGESSFPLRLRDWPGAPSQPPQPGLRRTTSNATCPGNLALQMCQVAVERGVYPYIVLSFSIVGLICSYVGHSFMIAPYNASVMHDLDFSPTKLSSIWAFTLILSAAWLNLVGFLVDRIGAQPVIFLGGIGQLLGLTCFSQADGPLSIVVAFVLVRLSSVETVDFACRHCLNQWFAERRGIAAGILNSVSSIGFFLPALETASVLKFGWRSTAAGIGMASGSVIMFCSIFLLSRPEDYNMIALRPSSNGGSWSDAISQAGSECDDESFTFREAVRTPLLWALMLSWFVMCVPWAGINFLLVSILKEEHHTQSDAVFIYVMLAVFSALAAVVCGALEDRVPRSKKQLTVTWVNGAMLCTLLVGAVFHWIQGPLGPILLGCGLGIWEGTGNVVSTTIIPHLYGRKHLGAIRGLFMASAQVSSGAGPLIISLGMDVGMSIGVLCGVLACFQAVAIMLVCVLPRPRRHKVQAVDSLESSLLSS